MSTVVDADERLARIERLAPRPGLPIMSEVVAEIAREAESYVAALDRFAADARAEEGVGFVNSVTSICRRILLALGLQFAIRSGERPRRAADRTTPSGDRVIACGVR